MAERIYTIPVNDAFQSEEQTCPLCHLAQTVTQQQVDYFLSPAQMEVDVRESCNQNGFCPEHLHSLNCAEKNRLTLALTLSTHLPVLKSKLETLRQQAQKSLDGSLFKRKWKEYVDQLADALECGTHCLICNAVEEWMGHFVEVILEQLSEPDFAECFRQRPICLTHQASLLRACRSKKTAQLLLSLLQEKQEAELGSLIEDLIWFTLKFDYRYKDEPWKTAKDAIPRSVRYLGGEKK